MQNFIPVNPFKRADYFLPKLIFGKFVIPCFQQRISSLFSRLLVTPQQSDQCSFQQVSCPPKNDKCRSTSDCTLVHLTILLPGAKEELQTFLKRKRTLCSFSHSGHTDESVVTSSSCAPQRTGEPPECSRHRNRTVHIKSIRLAL